MSTLTYCITEELNWCLLCYKLSDVINVCGLFLKVCETNTLTVLMCLRRLTEWTIHFCSHNSILVAWKLARLIFLYWPSSSFVIVSSLCHIVLDSYHINKWHLIMSGSITLEHTAIIHSNPTKLDNLFLSFCHIVKEIPYKRTFRNL